MTTQSSPVVTVCDGVVTTLSTNVAEYFQKRHNDVIRAIEKIVETLPSDRLRNFAQTVVTRENPSGGAPIESKAYRLTRDGFTFLAMGFTGERAQAFKWAYIDAFNKMEAQLQNRDNTLQVATLTPAQQLLVRQAVASRAKTESKHYQTIYRAIYNRFQIARYDQLHQSDLNECLKFINEVDLRVPEAPKAEPEKALPTKPRVTYTVTADFLEKQRTFVYCIRYLFRDPLMQAMKVMQALDVPNANMLWDVVHDFNLAELESNLDRLGYPVKELECYKHLMRIKK